MRSVTFVVVLALVVAAAAGACSLAGGCTGRDGCLRVLFLGNSYTYVNDLPGTFAALARAGGHRVEVGMVAAGGETLAGHVASADTTARLQPGRWDVVVLQEQSEIPADAHARQGGMEPAAATLAATIRGIGARPVLFETWAHEGGWPEDGLAGYDVMQAAIDAGYDEASAALSVPVVPVGAAWSAAHTARPDLPLWQSDGSHPTLEGTWLAAAVFYAALLGADPVAVAGSADRSTVPDAGQLAEAARVALGAALG
jgi:hypothetical protein